MNEDLDLEVRARSFRDYINENRKIKDILTWVWRMFLSRENKRTIKQIMAAVFLGNLLSVLGSYYAIRNIIDGIVESDDVFLLRGFIALGVILIGARFANLWRNILRERFFADFGAKMNDRISRLFFEKSLGTHTSEDNVLNESNVSKGHERLTDMIYATVIDGPDMFGGLSVAFIALWFIQPVVALIITCTVVLYFVWGGLINYRIMIEGYPIEKMWRHLNRFRKERWKNIERVKSNAKEKEELIMLNNYYDESITLDLKLWSAVLKLWCKRSVVSAFMFLGALIYGVRQIRIGDLSPGWVYPMFSLGFQVYDSLWRISDLERRVHYNLWSASILKEALSLPVGLTFKENPIVLSRNSPCRIEFDAVSYRFKENGNSPLVLSDVSFTIEPHQKVAIIGTSGAGKSTLMKLLLRYMDPTGGRIKIDGHDLRDINLDSWLSIIGYIPQQPQIFSGTMRYNATYGLYGDQLKNVSDAYLWEQARMLQVDFGERLINGLDTMVGERGVKLSGGQNQRLMILAAVMKDPKLMVIDEATSSLDSSTEKLVQAGLDEVLSGDCSALVVAHRLSTVRKCDKFIVIEPMNESGGKVVGVGKSFGELFEMCPQFRKLAEDQELRI